MISIVIPTYNEGKYLDATLGYLTKNLPSDGFEIIVSDSQSTDDTAAIAKNYPGRVTLVQMPVGKKRGISQGRNDGAAAAHGEFLLFMDADIVIPTPQIFLEKILAQFKNDPKLVAIATKINVTPAVAHISDNIVYFFLNSFFIIMNKLGFGMAAGEFQVMPTKIFHQVGGFNESLAASEDMDLFARLAKVGHTRILRDMSVYHSGRRFRKAGTWTTVFLWMRNSLSVWIFKKSADKEWKVIR